jgi:hypothetical protein
MVRGKQVSYDKVITKGKNKKMKLYLGIQTLLEEKRDWYKKLIKNIQKS